MTKTITKRDGTIVDFDFDKILNAVYRAGEETGEYGRGESYDLAYDVKDALGEHNASVEEVQDVVENVLLETEHKATAKAFILYRNERDLARKPDIFKYRMNLKPYEYPQLLGYKEAIQHSYWLHTEFNYTSDINDFHSNVTDVEANAIKNAMLAIAQVEVAVKNFWGDLHHRMPKPEIGAVGATFAANEVIHHDAYAHLLEILGMNDEFERIKDTPELMQRVDYLTKASKLAKTESDKDFTLSLILFSLFVEHVSLFSQFLIIMAFNKHRNIFKGISNVIEATSKEEQIHGLFGVELVNIVREEKPEWFDEDMADNVYAACRQAFESEKVVIDWIYEGGELDFLPKNVVKEFVKNRLNEALVNIGYEAIFDVDEAMVDETEWFLDELNSTKHVDFFVKRSVNYTKRTQSFTGGDLF